MVGLVSTVLGGWPMGLVSTVGRVSTVLGGLPMVLSVTGVTRCPVSRHASST